MSHLDRYCRKATPFTSRVQGEVVMMSLETNNYYGLGAVGTRIWELLEEPRDLDALCAALQEEYQVDAETCRRDTQAFLEALEREHLVVRVS